MEHCRSPDGVTSISVRPYYVMLSRVYLALAMGFLVVLVSRNCNRLSSCLHAVSERNHSLLFTLWCIKCCLICMTSLSR